MSNVLYKVLMLAAVVSFFAIAIALMPTATPLPEVVVSFIEWAFGSLYFFDDILDIPTFLTAIYTVLNGILVYATLLLVTIIVKWGISTSS